MHRASAPESIAREPEATHRVHSVPIAELGTEDLRFQFRIDACLDELCRSVEARGQQIPVVLWRGPPFIVIDGFRRIAALRSLGRDTVEAVVRDDLDERGAFALSFTLNVQRRTLAPMERAHAIRLAVDRHGLSVSHIAPQLGLSERQVRYAYGQARW